MRIFQSWILSVFVAMAICMPDYCLALKIPPIPNFSKYEKDIAKIGKSSKNVLSDVQKKQLISKYPRLAGKSDDVLKGMYFMESTAAKNPVLVKLIEKGANPAEVAIIAHRSPKDLAIYVKTMDILENAKSFQDRVEKNKLPAAAREALDELIGNPAVASATYFEMLKRGGQKAVDIAQKLLPHITTGKTSATVAIGLLAWHMVDPEGAEQSINEFLADHVAPLVTAPIEGIGKGATKIVDGTMTTIEDSAITLLKNHWLLLIISLAIFLLLMSRQFRMFLPTLIDKVFGKLNNKINN